MPARHLPPLGTLRAFEAAARHRSFKAAATELAVTPTAISHQIRQLELTLGIRLFERQTRRVSLTDAGEYLFPVIRDGLDNFAVALDRLTARQRHSSLTLSATPAFVAKWLIPRLSTWNAHHKQIDLRLHASEEAIDFASGVADIAIRFGRGPYPGLHSELLLTCNFAPVAAPQLKLRRAEDLKRQTLLHFQWHRSRRDTPTWRLWATQAGLSDLDTSKGVRFSDEAHAIQAAIAGQGVALLSLPLVAAELSSGALVQPFGPILTADSYHLVLPPEQLERPEIIALRDWLHSVV